MASNSQLHASSENFNTQLELFYKQNKIDLRTNPRIGRTRINLYNLYSHVIELGGSSKVDTENQWTSLIPHFNGVAADELRNIYKEYLEAYEQVTFWGKQYVVSNKRKSDPTKKLKRESNFKSSAPQKPAPLFEDTEYTDGGYSNRILLALESQLPNEVDWALKKLLSITFTSDRFQFSVIPGLLDLLIEMMNDYIDKEMKHIKKMSTQSNGLAHEASPLSLASEEIFHAYQSREERERVFLISAILWNSSFAVDNIRIFVCFPPLKELIVKALSLPSSSSYLEIKLSLLDVMDNIAFCFKLTPKDDPLIPVLNKLVFDNDRGLILGAIRTLVRLAIIESNDQALKSTLDPKIVPRMYQLLLLPDEEIVASVLDYFYQYSLLSTAISTQFAELAPSNPVKILMKFLGYKIPSNVAFMPPKIVFQTSKRSEAGKEKDGLTKDQQTKIAALVKDANLLKQLLFETFTVMSNGTELKLEKMEEPGRFGAWLVTISAYVVFVTYNLMRTCCW
ncbi:hypothetical protein BKA69DRAFT_382711 [Paraphysoderma sedebokerense]|nr:hypothetical protein BKA69DRAFT_382711 [Paraphysoderma sedebokerense]